MAKPVRIVFGASDPKCPRRVGEWDAASRTITIVESDFAPDSVGTVIDWTHDQLPWEPVVFPATDVDGAPATLTMPAAWSIEEPRPDRKD